VAAGVVDATSDQPHDRTFEHERCGERYMIRYALLVVGRVGAIDCAPHEREELFADDPGQDPGEGADR
jgi:hypothetical protein